MPAARQITDRAKRYRAQKTVRGKKVCAICGKRPRRIDVMHLDGNESHGEAANLAYGCRSCNGRLAVAFKKIGAGLPTNQYNPAAGHVPTFEQYAWAVSQQRHSGEHGEPGAIIHATPKAKRTEYAIRILRKAGTTRRAAHEDRWNPSMRSSRGIGLRDGRKLRGASAEKLDRLADAWIRSAGYAGASVAHERDEYRAGLQDAVNEFERAYRGNPVEVTSTDKQQAEFAAKDLRRKGHVAVKVIKRTRGEAWQSHGAHKPVYVVTSRGQLTRNPGSQQFKTLAEARSYAAEMKAMGYAGVSVQRTPYTFAGIGGVPEHYYEVTWGKLANPSRNPAAASAEVYKEFHGHGPREVVTVVKRIHSHEHLAAAGALRRLVVLGIDKRKHTIRDFGGAILAFNENKNQLFVEGGDQSLNLEDYGIDSPHELETLGKVQKIDYKADKSHLGAEGGRATYTHQFRTTNENGRHVVVSVSRYPDLVYDVPNQQLLFSGGSYTIRAEGIDV